MLAESISASPQLPRRCNEANLGKTKARRFPARCQGRLRGGVRPATRGICGAGGRNRKEGRKPRRPQGARQGPNGQGTAFGFPLPHDRAATRCAPDHAARIRFASPCRSGLARGGFAGPRLRPSSSADRPRRKSRRVARFRALREAHMAADVLRGDCPPFAMLAQNESPAVSRRAFVLVVELAPIRPCGASGAARGPRAPARRSKARGPMPQSKARMFQKPALKYWFSKPYEHPLLHLLHRVLRLR